MFQVYTWPALATSGFDSVERNISVRNPQSRSAQELLCDSAIQINRLRQLPLLDVLAVGVRHMNRSRTEQQRFAPVGELWDVGSKRRDHRGQTVHCAQAKERKLQRERDLHRIA